MYWRLGNRTKCEISDMVHLKLQMSVIMTNLSLPNVSIFVVSTVLDTKCV